MDQTSTRLRFLRRRGDRAHQRFRRGVYLLPSLFTVANMFCGYACVVYAMRGEFAIAAPFIGIAIGLDMFDGRIARMTGTESAFGVQFDSLADVISFGIAPAILMFQWGLKPLEQMGWTASFLFVTAAAMRLARFNIQASTAGGDKRYFVGMPTPAAAAVPAATVFAYPAGFTDYRAALPALAVILVPAALMVSTIRFRSFKTIDLQTRRPYTVLLLIAASLTLIVTQVQIALLIMAYTYLASAFIGMAVTRLRQRGGRAASGRRHAGDDASSSRPAHEEASSPPAVHDSAAR